MWLLLWHDICKARKSSLTEGGHKWCIHNISKYTVEPYVTLSFELTHLSCCGTMGIYRNVCLSSLVRIRWTVLKMYAEKDFCDQSRHVTSWPQSWLFHVLPILREPLEPIGVKFSLLFLILLSVQFTSLVTDRRTNQGRSDGGYIVIYTPKISNRFVHVWDINTCFEIAMTS